MGALIVGALLLFIGFVLVVVPGFRAVKRHPPGSPARNAKRYTVPAMRGAAIALVGMIVIIVATFDYIVRAFIEVFGLA